jgi:hypothetical protein
VHRVTRAPVDKWQALAILRGVRQIDRATLKAVCLALDAIKPGLGFDIDNMPAEAAPKQYAKRPPRKAKLNGKTVNLERRNALDEAIEARHDLTWLVENHFGRVHGGGGKYAGPCHEPPGGALSFSLFTGNDGTLLWKCHGDCAGSKPSSGGQISLYHAWLMRGHGGPKRKNVTKDEARDELARLYGIDPDAFRAAQDEKEEAHRAAFATLVKVPRLIQCWVDETTEKVRKNYAPAAVNAVLQKVGRAFSAVVIQAHKGRDAPLPNDVNDSMIASALLNAMPGLMTISDHVDEVIATRERLKAGKPTMGHAWIETIFGGWSLSYLLHALAYQLGRPLVELHALMPGRRYREGSRQRNTVKSIVEGISVDATVPADVKARSALISNMYCASYKSEGFGDGHKVATRIAICATFMVCRACNWVRINTDFELAASEKKEDQDVSWVGRGQVHSVCMTVRNTTEAVALVARVDKRVKQPKRRSFGATEKGEVTVRWSTNDEGVAVEIRAECDTWATDLDRTDVSVHETSVNHTKGPERIVNDYMSLQRNTDRLIRLGPAGEETLKAWLWWTSHHRMISGSKRALPWPTRERAREHLKEKNKDKEGGPEHDGQKITWKLVHVRTGFVIAEQDDYPFTIGQAIRLAAVNTSFRNALANNPVQTQTG